MARARDYRVVLLDDHDLFRLGLRQMLDGSGLQVVGEGRDGEAGLALIRDLHPDVVVTDLSMPGESGPGLVREMVAAVPSPRVVVLSVSAGEQSVLASVGAGACAYLLKETPRDRLVPAIRAAAGGHLVFDQAIFAPLAARIRTMPGSAARHRARGGELTPRELAVLRLIAAGADNATIGRELSISPHTAKRYVTLILEKIGVHSRVQAAVYAVRSGLA